jgi:hypothetical protein
MARMILDRRQFFQGLPAMLASTAAAAAESEGKTRFYVVEQYLLEQGTQPGRINDFFSRTLLPAMNRVHKGPKIFLEALIAPHMPMVTAIVGVESCDQIWSISKQLFADKDFSKAFDEWEAGEAPYVQVNCSLLEATDFSPEISVPSEPGAPRIFEMRTYHSPTARQLKGLLERFAGAEIEVFHRSGIHPVLYTTTVFGESRPNLTYLMPFDSLGAREKAWAAFAADPEWIKVRKESVAKYGADIVAVQNMSLHRATAYSPVR